MKLKIYQWVLAIIMIVTTIAGASAQEITCYQEQANESTACGGLSTGNYGDIEAEWDTTTGYQAYDANYSTFSAYTLSGQSGDIFINYSKPPGALPWSVWQIKDVDGIENLTLPIGCMFQTPLQLLIQSHPGGGGDYKHTDWMCYNGTGYQLLKNTTGLDSNRVYEEAMIWQLAFPRGNATFDPTQNFTILEGQNQTFTINPVQPVNVTGPTTVNIFQWLKNGISQSFSSAWNWVIGYEEAGNVTITGIANDSFGEVARQIFNVEVLNVNQPPENLTSVSPNTGAYDISVIVSCSEAEDIDNDVIYYEIQADYGSGWTTVSNNTFGVTTLDLTEMAYGTTVDTRCRAYDGEFLTPFVNSPGNLTRTEQFMFYMYDFRTLPVYTENKPYQLGVYANTANDYINITDVSFDCNGDRLTDYYMAYDDGVRTANEYFTCLNLPGNIAHIVTINLERANDTIRWNNACNSDELNCTIERIYNLEVI